MRKVAGRPLALRKERKGGSFDKTFAHPLKLPDNLFIHHTNEISEF